MTTKTADEQFNALVMDIYENGVWEQPEDIRAKWADGTPAATKAVNDVQLKFENQDDNKAPILTTKFVAWKTAIHEILWIWQQKSNEISYLQERGIHIWDSWAVRNPLGGFGGTIGKGYGFQLNEKCRSVFMPRPDSNSVWTHSSVEMDQVDYMLHLLTTSPGSRRNIVTLWDKNDLDYMTITPCVWSSQWIRKNGKLNLTVNVRSNDICVGNPFNVFQYYVLQRMVSQVTNIPMGTLVFNITDAHIYDRHLETAVIQVQEPMFEPPVLEIDPSVKNFYDFRIEHFNLVNYQYSKKFSYEVAI